MQSQLAAALLGPSILPNRNHLTTNYPTTMPSTSTTVTSTITKNEDEELESEDIDDFNDEEFEKSIQNAQAHSRTVTLQMLLSANILQPGQSAMTIEYLGQRFVGDLLSDGKIKSQETETIFCSPSAWAIHCKRIINPDKKSGCGWASVKYKGKKLDAYKAQWLKMCQQQRDSTPTDDEREVETPVPPTPAAPVQRVVVKHNTVPNRMVLHDSNTLIEAVTFSSLGKIQPFLVSLTTNAVLLIDFHCHLTTSEVCGYLAGTWDVNTHNLAITHAFPCRNSKHDRDNAPTVELEIQKALMSQPQLIIVGWYHSHPKSPAMPTLRDCDHQLEYQIKMKGPSDATYSPCVGIICSPYNPDSPTLESTIISYWVTPPPENRPSEYGRPMLMSYSVVQDSHLSPDTMDEMKRCIEYYSTSSDLVDFKAPYMDTVNYVDKLKLTLTSKFPRDQSDGVLWNFIKDLIGCPGDDKIDTSALLSIPLANKTEIQIPSSLSSLQAQLNLPISLSSQINIPAGLSVSSISNNLPKFDLNSTLQIPMPKSTMESSMGSLLSASSLAASLANFTNKLPTSLASTSNNLSVGNIAASLAATIPTSLAGNLMLSSTDIANALFQSGKFPSTSALLGLPDPMSKSTLAANNMFLSPSLMKMQDTFCLLKPLSSSSPLNSKSSDIKIPQDLNISKYGDFPALDLNSTKVKFDASDLSISSVKPNKVEFSAADLSVSSVNTNQEVNLKKKIDFSVAELTGPPNKIPKTDFSSMLDLTSSESSAASVGHFKNSFIESLASLSGTKIENFGAKIENISNNPKTPQPDDDNGQLTEEFNEPFINDNFENISPVDDLLNLETEKA